MNKTQQSRYLEELREHISRYLQELRKPEPASATIEAARAELIRLRPAAPWTNIFARIAENRQAGLPSVEQILGLGLSYEIRHYPAWEVVHVQPYWHHGGEFDWVARDRVGRLALFSTAGLGWPTVFAYMNRDLMSAATDQLANLPVTSEVEAFQPLEDVFIGWRELAERGFMVFDWDASANQYQLEAVPSRYLTFEELPEGPLREVLAQQILPTDFLAEPVFGRATRQR